MNVAIVLPNWIGDVVMATPALRALRRFYGPETTITGLMKPYVRHVLQGTSWLDQTILYDRHARDIRRRPRAVIRELRALNLDTIVVLPNSFSSAWLARWSGAAHRFGFSGNGRSWLLNRRLPRKRERGRLVPESVVDACLRIAYAVGCPHESPRLELATGPSAERIAAETWERLELHSASRVVVFNTGSAQGDAKSWDPASFADLAQRIVTEHDASVLIICGPNEAETAAHIAASASHPRVVSMAEQDLSLGVAKACVRRSDLMITTDSGPRHFAAAFAVPVVSLFGPIDPRWSANYHPHELALREPVPCSPCGKHRCPLQHHACMRDLTVDRVYRAVTEQLHRHAARKAA